MGQRVPKLTVKPFDGGTVFCGFIFDTPFFYPVFYLPERNIKMLCHVILIDIVGTDIFLYFSEEHHIETVRTKSFCIVIRQWSLAVLTYLYVVKKTLRMFHKYYLPKI